MDFLGWKDLDILLASGNVYVDHPAFGSALLGRWLVEKYQKDLISLRQRE